LAERTTSRHEVEAPEEQLDIPAKNPAHDLGPGLNVASLDAGHQLSQQPSRLPLTVPVPAPPGVPRGPGLTLGGPWPRGVLPRLPAPDGSMATQLVEGGVAVVRLSGLR
jgi:hypothetical protein